MQNKKDSRITVRDLTYIALSATLTILCAWLRVPFVIPITLQSFAVFFITALLGGRLATISVIIYIGLGALGLPVFSGFAGGIGYLLGSTGGYIFGFLLPPLFLWCFEKFRFTKAFSTVSALTLGLLGCYTFGTLWYVFLYAEGTQNFAAVLTLCVVPFLLPDAIKLALALFISSRIKKQLKNKF